MKKYKVIRFRNLPSRIPITPTLTALLALDHWNVPQWGCGVAYTLIAIWWLSFFVSKAYEVETDVFESQSTKP